MRGAEASSDHYLLVANTKLKLKRCRNPKLCSRVNYDVAKLVHPEVKRTFSMQLKNRFQCLQTENANKTESEDNDTRYVSQRWEEFKTVKTKKEREQRMD